MKSKHQKLFIVLAGFFIINAIVAEFIGVKIFSLESTIGVSQAKWMLFGSPFSFDLTAGVLLWPVVFVMTDIINEHYGMQGVKFLSWLTAALIVYAFFMVFMAIKLVPAAWWPGSQSINGISDMQAAFKSIFGQGLWIIVGSLISFLVGQLLDALLFQKLKIIYKSKKLWLRATISTLVSQLIDSYLVLFIAFYIGNSWSFVRVMSIGTGNYIYKFVIAILMIPVLYGIHFLIKNYLNKNNNLAEVE